MGKEGGGWESEYEGKGEFVGGGWGKSGGVWGYWGEWGIDEGVKVERCEKGLCGLRGICGGWGKGDGGRCNMGKG